MMYIHSQSTLKRIPYLPSKEPIGTNRTMSDQGSRSLWIVHCAYSFKDSKAHTYSTKGRVPENEPPGTV